jgi:hypothetical protein
VKKTEFDHEVWSQNICDWTHGSPLWQRVALGVALISERMPFEPEELLVHVSNKLKLIDALNERNATFLGKLINKFTREELGFVILNGIAVKQLYEFADETPPSIVDINARYEIHREAVRELYNRAQKAISSQESDNA